MNRESARRPGPALARRSGPLLVFIPRSPKRLARAEPALSERRKVCARLNRRARRTFLAECRTLDGCTFAGAVNRPDMIGSLCFELWRHALDTPSNETVFGRSGPDRYSTRFD